MRAGSLLAAMAAVVAGCGATTSPHSATPTQLDGSWLKRADAICAKADAQVGRTAAPDPTSGASQDDYYANVELVWRRESQQLGALPGASKLTTSILSDFAALIDKLSLLRSQHDLGLGQVIKSRADLADRARQAGLRICFQSGVDSASQRQALRRFRTAAGTLCSNYGARLKPLQARFKGTLTNRELLAFSREALPIVAKYMNGLAGLPRPMTGTGGFLAQRLVALQRKAYRASRREFQLEARGDFKGAERVFTNVLSHARSQVSIVMQWLAISCG